MVYVMRNGRRVIAALSFLLLCCGVHVHAQRVAVKTNALGWLTASPNVEAEFVLGSHVSLNMGIAANPISTDNFKTTFTHFQPEVRYWLNRPMVSHFLGITAFVNNFDMMVKDGAGRSCVSIGQTGGVWIRMGAGRSLEHRSNCRSGCVALPSV